MCNCINCENEITGSGKKYCSYTCQQTFQRTQKIQLWLEGKIDGRRGKTSTGRFIKRYLIDKFGEKCMKCGWCERNKFTNLIPIELEHIDGDFLNNKVENLELLCPNCHSLTKTYKGANKKKGRPRAKYYRGL